MTSKLMGRIRDLDRHRKAESLLQEAIDEQREVNKRAFRLALTVSLQAEDIEQRETSNNHDDAGESAT